MSIPLEACGSRESLSVHQAPASRPRQPLTAATSAPLFRCTISLRICGCSSDGLAMPTPRCLSDVHLLAPPVLFYDSGILLITHVLVGRKKHVESGLFGCSQQFAVL